MMMMVMKIIMMMISTAIATYVSRITEIEITV